MRYHSLLRVAGSQSMAETDPYFSAVVLLLDTSTPPTYTDASPLSHTLTLNGGITNQVGVFGGNAIGVGSGAYLSAAETLPWAFGTGDFTIEASIYSSSAFSGSEGGFMGAQSSVNTGWALYIDSVGTGPSATQVTFWARNAFVLSANTTISANTWYAIAVQRVSGQVSIFVNGVPSATTNYASGLSGGMLRIGHPSTAFSTVGAMNGRLDQVRITNGVGRYDNGGYLIRTTPFPKQ